MSSNVYTERLDRDRLIGQVKRYVSSECKKNDELVGLQSEIGQSVVTTLNLLPRTVARKTEIAIRCCPAVDETIRTLSGEDESVAAQLNQLRDGICHTIMELLYSGYLHDSRKRLNQYCLSHEPPKNWGLGYLYRLANEDGDAWGQHFHKFWRNSMEAEGDEYFRETILTSLPLNWRESYRMRHKHDYEWPTMTVQDLVSTIMSLERERDPSFKKWGLNSISTWIDAEGQMLGKCFTNFWHSHVESQGDAIFQKLILVHLPESWRKNYRALSDG
jgi:hypothetical protein